jgi:hypothetical protein
VVIDAALLCNSIPLRLSGSAEGVVTRVWANIDGDGRSMMAGI